MHDFNWYGGGWMMMFWWILIIVFVVGFSWWAMSLRQNRENKKSSDPMDTLKDRYARGEIDKEEFESKKKTLLN